MLKIEVNGQVHEVPEGTTLADLIRRLGKQPQYLAVERNRQLVPRARHAKCLLADGDRLEIVTLVGGG